MCNNATREYYQAEIEKITRQRNAAERRLENALRKIESMSERMVETTLRAGSVNPRGQMQQIARDGLMFAASLREDLEPPAAE